MDSPKINERQQELDEFLSKQFGINQPVVPSLVEGAQLHSGGDISDAEVFQRIQGSKHRDKFNKLKSGDITGYDSQSEADLALCIVLAIYTGGNPEQMDRMFRELGLYRGKWDEWRGGQTYGEMTLKKAIRIYEEEHGGSQSTIKGPIDPAKLLEEHEVRKEYVEKLGNEEYLHPNLIIRQHVITIIAESGGGKTTFFYYYIAPLLSKKGLIVYYIDADSPTSEHKVMKDVADEYCFKFINSDANHGTSVEGLIQRLKTIADSEADLTNWVIFIDTLKKMADLLQKNSVKQFYVLCRKLSARGATVVLLGHANKYRDKEGNLVFEGVGDVKSDSDELIFFERRTNQDGSIDVTTVVDTGKGAKVRGIFKPISFKISPDRKVTPYDEALKLPDLTTTGAVKATNDQILMATQEYLVECAEPVIQKELVQQVSAITGASSRRVRNLIVQNSAQKGAGVSLMFAYTKGGRNTFLYEIPQGVSTGR